MWLKLRATGRGRRYTALRGLVESAEKLAYTGGWPAHLWSLVPGATDVRTLEHRMALLPTRPERRPPLRIAFASDLHVGPVTPMRLLENAFDQIAAAQPDVLLLGGDYVSLEVTHADAARIAALCGRVPAPVKLAVLGNHDLWTRHEVIEQALASAGARVLVNQSVRLPPPWDDVAVVGLDDAWTGCADGARAFDGVDAALTIALSHTPDGLSEVQGRGARLMLCGHTHGGQVAAPWGPLVVASRVGRRWPHGLHAVDERLHLFVSRGLGASDLPIRAFAPPDVAIFHLTESDR